MKEINYVEVDELDFRLGLNELLSVHGRIDQETNKLINQVIAETKLRAMKASLVTYIDEGPKMSHQQMIEEEHDSGRLGEHLRISGYDKPTDDFEAHAIVSGAHQKAQIARMILAQFHIRIDDPSNGLWMPNFKRNMKRYPDYDKAHRTVHGKIYYLNITACLQQAMSPLHARAILRRIAQGLVTGSFVIDRQMTRRELRAFTKEYKK